MKNLAILVLFAMFFSCAKQIKGSKGKIYSSQEALVNKVIKSLHLKEENTSFISTVTNPSKANETIILLPETPDESEEEDYEELNTNISIINNKTGKITHRYFESSKSNGWISNAIFIHEIAVDTIDYKINKSKSAFGIIVKFRSQSQSNPYYSQYLSLYMKDKKSIKKIVDFYPVYEYSGQVSINSCYSDIEKEQRELIITNTKTNDFFDIAVKTIKSKIKHQENQNGNCDAIETAIDSSYSILKFNTQVYQEIIK